MKVYITIIATEDKVVNYIRKGVGVMKYHFPQTVVEAYRTRASVDRLIEITREKILQAPTASEARELETQLSELRGIRVRLSLFIYDRIGI